MPIGPNATQFDFENAVREGVITDPNTNDKHIDAKTLQIALGDTGGVEEFRILDSDEVAVVVADSDGYFSIAGNAEVHGGHILVRGEGLINSSFITLEDQSSGIDIFLFDTNPDGTYTAPMGSFGASYNDGYFYVNFDGATQWQRLALASQVNALVTTTLQTAYDNDLDGGDATITTNVTDGDVVVAGTEQLRVTAAGGFDVNTIGSFSLDADSNSSLNVTGANLTLSTTTSGDVTVRVPTTGGDFVVDQGVGAEFIRAASTANELRLGDLSPDIISVRVLSDMVVDGDLTVSGTTTYVNTENLYVEDRLLRLNVGTAPSFAGTTGIEMEVGSDGYVEFHWDDVVGRWEISIDRDSIPEAQTFRPLPYLADLPNTLDLSDTGFEGFPTLGPNLTGASVINTNATNFPYSFGDYMTDNSVQAALEAIDAYFIDLSISQIITLQRAYDNDADGGDATITTNATDGAVVIAGTQKFQVTATGGIDLDTIFDMDGSTFDVNATGAASIDASAASNFTVDGANLTLSTTTSGDVIVSAADDVDIDGTNITLDATSAISLDAGAASNFTTAAGALTLDGAAGIVLDGNGSNVRPATDDTDSLGAVGLGWTTVYLRNVEDGATVGLSDAGSSSTHNSTAGADAVGTNSLNFTRFGSLMTDNSVQSALEAIDGYLASISSDSVTLHTAYKNDLDGGDATILTDTADGSVVIAGTESFRVTADGGIDLDTGFDQDATGGQSFDVNLTGGGSFSLDAYAASSNVTVDAADLVVSTTTSGVLTLSGATGIVLDGTGDHVRPADDRVNTLGRADAGWLDVYLANVPNSATVALRAAGGTTAPNTTSGAHAVGTNALNFASFGPDMTDNSVQAALEAIDGYLSSFSVADLTDTLFTQEQGLLLFGALLNGNVNSRNVSGTPALSYQSGVVGRASWTIPVPKDWDGASDITVEVIWSAQTATVGDVAWRLEYKSLALTELASTATTDVDYTQTTSGTADEIQSTMANLVIPAGDIDTVNDEMIVINIVRRGGAGADTYVDRAQVHLVKYSYSAENIIS
jgi:hypothetical protein